MFKSIHVFIVVALMGIGASDQAFARAHKAFLDKNCITHPESCPKLPSAGAAKVRGKGRNGPTSAGQGHQKPVIRNGGCDSHMGGCIDNQ